MSAPRPLVLLVDDETQLHRILRPALEAAGYAIESALTGEDALRLAAAHGPACVLLDLGLPDMEGREVLRRMRGFLPSPVLVVSARDRVAEKIAALDAGAADYVEKPFDTGELLARIRAALRAHPPGPEQTPRFRAPPLEVDFERRTVRVEGAAVTLTPREYALLVMLIRNVGRVLTHRQILHAVWGPAHGEDVQYLRVYIQHLRRKLGRETAAMLQTEPGIGYRFREPEAAAASEA